MRSLREPYSERGDEFVGELLEECAANFTKRADRCERLLGCRQAVVDFSKEYRAGMPWNIESVRRTAESTLFPADDLERVYTEKIARPNAVGRKYYDHILNAGKEQGTCPICETGVVKELDHYLPKSRYPGLAITPANLIPLCSDCNRVGGKGGYSPTTYEETLFHPYFEEPPSYVWLRADLLLEDTPIAVYGVEELPDAVMRHRFERFVEVYDLGERYGALAVGVFGPDRTWCEKLLNKGGVEALRNYFVERRDVAEADNLNSWLSALYRAAVRQVMEIADKLGRA